MSLPATALGPGEGMFGSLAEPLSRTPEGRNVLHSAGPVSDAYIMSEDAVALIIGPPGSGKTTASIKKILKEGVSIRPGPDGVRRYVPGVWRQSYVNLWNATIKSWWKILPEELPGSHWVGSSPRPATHTIRFRDQWSVKYGSEIEIITQFRAFNEAADPDDVLGTEFTDCYLNEMPTLPEALFTALVTRVGRDPPFEVTRRDGCMYGDGNAPDVTNWVFRDFYENLKPGYALYKQPGGRAPGAENLQALGPNYYHQATQLNAHRPWWVRLMIDCRPGFNRDTPVIYPHFDDDVHVSGATLAPIPQLPVLVGIDGGFMPAAVYAQEMGDGQLRILGEVVLERGGAGELGRAMLAFEAHRFPARYGSSFEFRDNADPSTCAGEDNPALSDGAALEEGSFRIRLARRLGRNVKLADTNELSPRIAAIGDKIDLNLGAGRPGLLLDPSCKVLRRGFNQTFHYRTTRGTNDIASISKTVDSHACEAAQYAALLCGTSEARKRRSAIDAERQRRMEAARDAPRRNPLSRYAR